VVRAAGLGAILGRLFLPELLRTPHVRQNHAECSHESV
jgi:hypothetical protein